MTADELTKLWNEYTAACKVANDHAETVEAARVKYVRAAQEFRKTIETRECESCES